MEKKVKIVCRWLFFSGKYFLVLCGFRGRQVAERGQRRAYNPHNSVAYSSIAVG